MAGFYTKCGSRKGKKNQFLRTKVARRPIRLVGGGNSEGFHFAVEMAALEAEGRRGLRHVPTVFLELAQDELALVGAARLMQR